MVNKIFLEAKKNFNNQNVIATCNINNRIEEVMQLEDVYLEITNDVLNGTAKVTLVSYNSLKKINSYKDNLYFTIGKNKMKLDCYLEDYKENIECKDIYFKVLKIEKY